MVSIDEEPGIEIDTHAVGLYRWDPPKNAVLVLGNETYGLAREVRRCCTELVTIPMRGFQALDERAPYTGPGGVEDGEQGRGW
jgi:hypothetical protein